MKLGVSWLLFLLLVGPVLALPATTAADEVVIRIFGDKTAHNFLAPGIQAFNERFKGKYRAQVETIAQTTAVLDRAVAQFIAGTATYDVVSLNNYWVPQVAQYLEPLGPALQKAGIEPKATFGPGVVADVTYRNSVVALPYRLNLDVLFYRKDLLEEAGLRVPTTLDEFLAAARKLTRKSGGATVYGTGIKTPEPLWTVIAFAGHFMLPNGGRLITADRKHAHPSLKSPLAGKVLAVLRTLHQEGLTPNPLSLTFQENVVLFQQGRMAMNGENFTRAVQLEDPAKSRVAGKMAYAAMPSQKVGPEPPVYYGSAWTYAIDKNSKVKDAAWEYIRFITSPEIQKLNAVKTGNGATSPAVYDDPEVLRANPAARAVKAALEKGYTHPFPVPQLPQLQQAVHEEVQQVILGRKSPEAGGVAIFDRIDRALQ